MRYAYGIVISATLLSVFIYSLRKYKDIFSPLCIFSTMQFLMYVPSIMFATVEYDQYINDFSLYPVFIHQLLFIIAVFIGFMFNINGTSRKLDDRLIILSYKHNFPSYWLILSLFFIGVVAKIYTIFLSGGFLSVISDPSSAYFSLTKGSGYLEIMKYFVNIAILLIIYRISKDKSKVTILIASIMVIFYIFLDLIFTRRSTTIALALIIIFCVNYFIKRLRFRDFFKLRILLLSLFVGFLLAFMPIIRSGDLNNESLKNFNIEYSVKSILTRFSMVGRDVFVYEYFTINNFWLGKSYLNTFVSFIPSRVWQLKPAVDEGVYLTNLMNGISVSPSDGVRTLKFQFSIPFTSQGLLYANFGSTGVFFGGLLLGCIYSISYSKIRRKNKSIFDFAIYRVIIFEFGLTVMTLVNTLIELLVIKITILISQRNILKENIRKNVTEKI